MFQLGKKPEHKPYRMKGSRPLVETPVDTRVFGASGLWKCEVAGCGRYIQRAMSRGDHNLISHRFKYEIGRR